MPIIAAYQANVLGVMVVRFPNMVSSYRVSVLVNAILLFSWLVTQVYPSGLQSSIAAARMNGSQIRPRTAKPFRVRGVRAMMAFAPMM